MTKEELEKRVEIEMCLQRISIISSVRESLAAELNEIGYPDEYPEQFKELEQAYIDLDAAISKVLEEEAKTLLRFV